MIKLKILIFLLAIFALGSIAGATLEHLMTSHAGSVNHAPSIRDGDKYLPVLDSQLHLNGEQASEMRAILNETRDEYRTLCGAVRPRYNEVRDRARTRLRALLSPDQQSRFDTIVNDENCNCPDQNKDAIPQSN
jgi:hypothetical protein